MKPYVAPRASGVTAEPQAKRAIRAVDLTGSPGRRALWHPGAVAEGPPPEAPGPGRPSPMGYWLTDADDAEVDAASVASATLQITIEPPGMNPSPAPLAEPEGEPRGRRRPVQTARIKAPNPGDGELTLTIGPDGATVVASPAAWEALAGPVLLAVCQAWRFAAIDAEIDHLAERARLDLPLATRPGLNSLRQGRRLAADVEAMRALLLDLPHFEGALTDPLSYCSTERDATVYAALAETLGLEAWCGLIDERVEVVEAAHETATATLSEFRTFAWHAGLEALIVVILLGELALLARDLVITP